MIRRLYKGIGSFCELVRQPNTKTFYPDQRRKSQMRIIYDNLVWVLKHREINHFYYLWGFDRASFDRPDRYLPEQAFCRMRDRANACRQFGTHRARYICMLQDKFVFGQYLKALGFATPAVIALCDRDGLDWIATGKRLRWEDLPHQENMDGFLKDALGRCGKAVYPIRIQNRQLLVNGRLMTPAALRELMDGKYIIQQRLIQHAEMDRLYPHAVNTIRLVTLRRGDDIELVSGTFRMGAGGNPWDNWSSGGIGVGLNIETGRLNEKGMFRDSRGGMVSEHPETKVRFDTFEIPFYREAADLVRELHTFFYGVHSIGWDVAITDKGPSVIEGNNSWCIGFQQIHDTDIKQRFLASLNPTE
jgi:hypothetical protein